MGGDVQKFGEDDSKNTRHQERLNNGPADADCRLAVASFDISFDESEDEIAVFPEGTKVMPHRFTDIVECTSQIID